MAQSATKQTFVADLQTACNLMIQAKQLFADASNYYFKAGFNSGGANPITNSDVSANGLTAAQVAAGITFATQLANLFGNSAVTTGDYEATVQQLRTS